jgi:hypothetical protein
MGKMSPMTSSGDETGEKERMDREFQVNGELRWSS